MGGRVVRKGIVRARFTESAQVELSATRRGGFVRVFQREIDPKREYAPLLRAVDSHRRNDRYANG